MGLHSDQNWLPAPFPEHNQNLTACWVTDDFNPNLNVDDVDVSSDEEESEETKRRNAERKKLDQAKEKAALAQSSSNIFDRMDAGASESFTAQGAALVSAMAGGKSKDLSKYIHAANSDDEDEEAVKEDTKQYMVNPLTFGREDRSDEYGAIFGKDLEWFPDGLRVWKMERFLPKPVPVHLYGKFLTRETYLILEIADDEDGSKVLYPSHYSLQCAYRF